MSTAHKFLNKNFGNGFETHNAILDVTPYKPEVLILGTFNPNTPKSNFADFYYGRNYFWPGFKNLINNNTNLLKSTRMPRNGVPKAALNPTLPEILKLCAHFKLTFADLIIEVLNNNNPQYTILPNDNVIFNNIEYNLIADSKVGNVNGLEQLNNISQVSWNTANIIKYLCDNPQIKQLYFTRSTTGVWSIEWNKIINHKCMQTRRCVCIYTPSGRISKKITPLINSSELSRLLHHWVWVNLPNPNPVNSNPSYGNLDHSWLTSKGVNPNNF